MRQILNKNKTYKNDFNMEFIKLFTAKRNKK